nr:DEAD/DEAH box helicase family protein [Acidiphilium multivorum]
METGTGKTYVYLRTIFELNKQFGFTKFVIVVPSVAIKEGVQDAPDHRGPLQKHLRRRAVRLLPLRFRQARPGAQFRHQPGDPDHGGDRRRHQQKGREQPLQAQREGERREADRPDQGDAPDRHRGRAAERRWRSGRAWPGSADGHEPALHAALLRDPRGQAPHGLPPGCRGCL